MKSPFPGKYLRAADLGTAEPVVTLREVTMETLGDDTKPVVYFEGKERGLVLNKTNWNAIVEITGEDDSDDWGGHKVKLFVAKVEFQGKRVPAIRVDAPVTRAAVKAPIDTMDEPLEVDDDDVGF